MATNIIQSRLGSLIERIFRSSVVRQIESVLSGQLVHQELIDTSGMVKVIVIGETGSGKSTFINYLTNYFKHGTLDNLKVAIPSKFHPQVTENFFHQEHDMNDKTQSKTDSCNQYTFTDGTAQYLFIDTPGLSDTRGAQQDTVNITKIIEAAENLGGLTAVIIVANGAVARMTVNLRNVIAQLRGNLPDVVMDNVIVILTNTTRHTANFSLAALELNGNVYPYYVQNSAFSTDPLKWTQSAIISLRHDWNHAMHEIKTMIETLNTFKVKSVSAFKTMKDIRNEIKALMHKARLEVSEIQKMQDEIAMFEAALTQAKADTVTYKNYTKERVVDKVELVDAPYHSTLCQNCNHVCHDNCGLTESTTAGSQIFQGCWAISHGNCTQCQHKCSYTVHYHAKKTVKITKKKLQDILTEIKSKFDAASKDSIDFKKKITSTEDAKKMLEKALKQKNEDIKAKCHELRRICSGFNLVSELHALIDQLEMESSMLRNIDAKQQAQIFIRSLKEFCATIEKEENDQKEKKTLQKPTMNIVDTERPMEDQGQMTLVTSETKSTLGQVPQIPVADSDGYASDDVLNQLRALSSQPPKKVKKKTQNKIVRNNASSDDEKLSSDDEPSSDDDESTSGNESSEDESNSEKAPYLQVKTESTGKKKSKAQSSSALPTAAVSECEQLKILTISELLNRYRTCQNQCVTDLIVKELTQRSHGKSLSWIISPNDIVELTTSAQKYSLLDMTSLQHTYAHLKDRICAITEPDILKIEQVSSSWLIEIAVVHKLLNGFLKSSDPHIVPPPPDPSILPHYSRPSTPHHYQEQHYPYNQYYLSGYPSYPPDHYYNSTPLQSESSGLSRDTAHGRESVRNELQPDDRSSQSDLQHDFHSGSYHEQYRQSKIYSAYANQSRITDSP